MFLYSNLFSDGTTPIIGAFLFSIFSYFKVKEKAENVFGFTELFITFSYQ